VTADLNTPQKIAIAKDGSVFIADRGNQRVRRIDPRGIIQTVAGAGQPAGQSAGMLLEPEVIR